MRGFIIEIFRALAVLALIGLTGADIMFAFYNPTDLRWALFLFFLAILWSLIRLRQHEYPDTNGPSVPFRIRYFRTYGACATKEKDLPPSYDTLSSNPAASEAKVIMQVGHEGVSGAIPGTTQESTSEVVTGASSGTLLGTTSGASSSIRSMTVPGNTHRFTLRASSLTNPSMLSPDGLPSYETALIIEARHLSSL